MEKNGELAVSLFIKRIWQKNNCTFCIEWNDQLIHEYDLSTLQKHCQCASCIDQMTGKRKEGVHAISQSVTARAIKSVGRYGLQIQFSSGCSKGIYSYEELHEIGSRSQ